MSDTWEISGEVGAGMGPGRVPLAALFPLVQPLVFRSQAADSFGYFLPIEADGTNSIYLPDRQQTVNLFRNGTREFSGRVTTRKFIFNGTGQGWQIEVRGGWYELDKIPLISDASATYDLPAGNVATSIATVVAKAITDGARLQLGTIATMLDVFALQFRAATAAATVRDLLRFAQDAMTYVDYTCEGCPTLHITRRTTAAARSFVLGQDAVTQCELSPDDDATPDRVDFVYALADTNGVVSQLTESAGAETPTNRLQVVTASTGFEDFQTQAIAGQQTMQTSTGLTWAGVLNADPVLSDFCTANSVPTFTEGAGSYNDQNDPSFPSSTFSVTFPATVYTSSSDTTGMLVIAKGQWRDWMTKLGITSAKAEALAYFRLTGTGLSLPSWYADFPIPSFSHQGFASGAPAGKWIIWCQIKVSVDMISRTIATDTVLRDPGDYSLVAPPAGIAPFLLETMGDAPYDGMIELDSFQDYARTLGRVINVDGGPAELNTARAMTREESYNLQTGTSSIRCGQSAAGSGLDLMSRFRRLSAK